MPIGTLKEQKLRDKKDHFVITLYSGLRSKYNINHLSIILFEINGNILIRIPNKDFHITIPRKIIKINQKYIDITILKVYNKELSRLRTNNLFIGDLINIESFIPKKTIFGNEIYILEDNPYVYVWYSISGGVRPLRIKTTINAERLAELLGFYFGDGNTSYNIRNFRLNNCESSTLNHCLDILEDLGLSRNIIKVQIIYSSNKELNEDIKNRCISYWKEELKINMEQIVSVNLSKNKNESLKYGSARIFIDNAILTEIFIHGLLKKVVLIIQNPKNKFERKMLVGFLRGLAAAEGGINLNKYNSLSKVSLSFDPHSNELSFYKKILENLKITYGKDHGNELLIYGKENFKILNELDIFKMHKKRKEKFLFGYKNHKFLK